MLQVSQLFIYPIKSLAGIALTSTAITGRGFQYDRRWMLIDEKNRFLSQRDSAIMPLLQVAIEGKELIVYHQLQPENKLAIPLVPATSKFVDVFIWDNQCNAQLVSDAADNWFSDMLNMPCRLVYMPDECKVPVDQQYGEPGDLTSFSDGYPILMISEASLADLNGKTEEPVPMNRFRPNLVIKGATAFGEDTMAAFEINTVPFVGVKPCGRCVITTIDQQTGLQQKEPLKTLSTYRKKNNKILFGENIIPRGIGTIRIGDNIQIHCTKDAIF